MAFNGGGDDGSARPTTTVPPVRLTSASTSTTEPHYYESLAQNENLTFYATVYAISIVALFATGLFKAMIFIRVFFKLSIYIILYNYINGLQKLFSLCRYHFVHQRIFTTECYRTLFMLSLAFLTSLHRAESLIGSPKIWMRVRAFS